MEYQTTLNVLGNTPNQTIKFRRKNWVEINDDPCETYNTKSQIEFKTSVLRSTLRDYCNAYILISGTIDLKMLKMLRC